MMKHATFQIGTKDDIEVFEGITMNEAAEFISKSPEGRENYDDSFYICDFGDFARKHKRWQELFPTSRPFYAIKVAPYPPMIRCLSALGAGFDCASQEEIDLALNNGSTPDSIIFANPSKPVSHIIHARENGVKMLVFDSELELLKIKKHFPDSELVLRILVDNPRAKIPLHDKFGATLEQSRHLISTAKYIKMKIIGISFHVGSGCLDANSFKETIENARELFDYGKKFEMNFNILDIGGGFPGLPDPDLSIEEIATVVNASLEINFPSKIFDNLRVIAEPGRYYAATAFVLATKVIMKKEFTKMPNVDAEYTINEGLYGSLIYLHEPFPGEKHPYIPEEKANKDRHFAWLWGPTCDSRVVSERILVPKLDCGDWLFWKNAGAYSFACASSFNGFRTTAFYNIISKENEEIFWPLMNDEAEVLWKR
uniref:ornithine decarboxylase 1-like isoform X2 n=1 Tax=Styela clava TaxID=7725 RepID=UPI001939E0EC|nr:ornithine decarboxylase 1-like isoform X2 [Styela clava]